MEKIFRPSSTYIFFFESSIPASMNQIKKNERNFCTAPKHVTSVLVLKDWFWNQGITIKQIVEFITEVKVMSHIFAHLFPL